MRENNINRILNKAPSLEAKDFEELSDKQIENIATPGGMALLQSGLIHPSEFKEFSSEQIKKMTSLAAHLIISGKAELSEFKEFSAQEIETILFYGKDLLKDEKVKISDFIGLREHQIENILRWFNGRNLLVHDVVKLSDFIGLREHQIENLLTFGLEEVREAGGDAKNFINNKKIKFSFKDGDVTCSFDDWKKVKSRFEDLDIRSLYPILDSDSKGSLLTSLMCFKKIAKDVKQNSPKPVQHMILKDAFEGIGNESLNKLILDNLNTPNLGKNKFVEILNSVRKESQERSL